MAKAFKEWQVVCDALASGRQWLILRKGGIHEGRAGFSFAEEVFFLFPTRFHHQQDMVREGTVIPAPEWQVGDEVEISHYVEVPQAVTLTDGSLLESLAHAHILTEETVRQRFDWEGKGMAAGSIHVAIARVWRLAEPFRFPYEARHGGCRSWVEIPDAPAGWQEGLVPVIDDEEFRKRLGSLPEMNTI